jgi:Helix-turn-helix domain of resolvase
MTAMTRPKEDVEAARHLLAAGYSIAETARRVGVARATIRDWMAAGFDEILPRRFTETGSDGRCKFCRFIRDLTESSYAYLLGLYLGDGMISDAAKGVYKLRIFLDNKYPVIIRQCVIAMHWVVPNKVGILQRPGCKEIYCCSKHWPCLFPQHGAGPKHTRPIVLEPWQRLVAIERNPQILLRGLIHSDGCRATNTVRVRGKEYVYPRYQFSNRSADIRRIFTDACDRAGIEWRQSYQWTISISKRPSIEKMDTFIGPKS